MGVRFLCGGAVFIGLLVGCTDLAGLNDYGPAAESTGPGGGSPGGGGSGGTPSGAGGAGGRGGTAAGTATGGGGREVTDYHQAVMNTRPPPLAYWRLGEAEKTGMAMDEMVFAHGSYVGGPTGVEGLVGDTDGATEFDWTQRVEVFPFPARQFHPNGFTVELWYRADAITVPMVLVALEPTFVLSVEPAASSGMQEITFKMGSAGAADDVEVTSEPFPIEGVHYVWARWSLGQLPHLVIDNGSGADAPTEPSFDTTDGPLVLGGSSEVGEGFAGVLDEVAIYDFAFNPGEHSHFEVGSRP